MARQGSRGAKRGHGEGLIRQRPDGRWEARVMIDGKPHSRYGRTRKEAQEKLDALRRGQQQGQPVFGERQTVADYLEHWLDHTARHTLRPRTFTRYQQLVRKHALPTIGKTALVRLTPQQLSALYGERISSGLSPRTVQFLHAVLHRALKQALHWNLVPRNVADAVRAPSPKRPEIMPLTPEQANALIDAAAGEPLEALYVLAITTGMRQGELLGLRWEDVDLADGRLHVRHTLVVPNGGGWELAEPKTRGSRRSIKLAPIAAAALKAHRPKQAAQRLQVGSEWQDHGLVFTSSIGTPVNYSHLRGRSFLPLLQRAGLPKIRFHDLRHTAATSLLKKDIPLVMVKDLLGHSTISITADLYSHVLPPHQAQVADEMERLFGKAVTG